MEPETVPIPMVRAARGRAQERERQQLAATVGVVVVGVSALSTALFQSVVGSSTTVQVGGPGDDAAAASPAAVASLDPANLSPSHPGTTGAVTDLPGAGELTYAWGDAVR